MKKHYRHWAKKMFSGLLRGKFFWKTITKESVWKLVDDENVTWPRIEMCVAQVYDAKEQNSGLLVEVDHQSESKTESNNTNSNQIKL